MKKMIFLMFSIGTLVFTSCSEDNPIPKPLVAPNTYDFTRNDKPTVVIADQVTLATMADQLVGALKTKPADITEAKLKAMFDHKANGADFTGDDADKLNAAAGNLKSSIGDNNIEARITDAVTNVFPNWENNASKGVAGKLKRIAKNDFRHFNAKGLELHEAVEKDFIGALSANTIATSLAKAKLDAANNDEGALVSGKNYTAMEHLWDDAYGALYGAKGEKGNPLATDAEGDTSFLNEYVERIAALPAFKEIAKTIHNAFKLGRAAIVAKKYDVRDKQAKIIIDNIAKVMAIRCVYYLDGGKSNLVSDKGTAFHTLSEGVGFIRALKFVQKNATKPFPNGELDGLYASLTSGDGFWDVTTEKIEAVSTRISGFYGFTIAQATTK